MRIARVELYALELPLVEPFIISGGRIDARRSVIVVLHDDTGHVGYGEAAPDELPFYSEETLGSARDLITRVLVPRIAGREFDAPEAVDAALRENVRGNPFARAGIETAAWDLEAHRRGTGLPQLVAERLGVAPAASFPCGVALGIPEDRRADTLTRRVYEALQHGYRRVKIKVAPGWDDVAVRAARSGMAGTDVPLTADANGAYDWPEHEPALRALDDAGLLYIEQPLAPDELVGHARLAHTLKTPLCLDETLARREDGAPGRSARRPDGVEPQGASGRRAHRGVPHLPGRGGVRGPAVGRNDARVRHRVPGGRRGRGARGVRLSVGRGAERALVRARCGCDQADHEPGRSHGRAGRVDRQIARRGALPFGDSQFTYRHIMIPIEHQPRGYWATNLYTSPPQASQVRSPAQRSAAARGPALQTGARRYACAAARHRADRVHGHRLEMGLDVRGRRA